MITVEGAKATIVFVFLDYENGEIVETTLYDHVMESVDKTTTPRGVGPRYFIEEVEIELFGDDYDDKDTLESYIRRMDLLFMDTGRVTIDNFDYDERRDTYYLKYYVISTWGVRGNNYKSGDRWGSQYSTEKFAGDSLFNRVYNHDFQNDCNRNTMYFHSEDEANADWATHMLS
jgi:hypothetical protein